MRDLSKPKRRAASDTCRVYLIDNDSLEIKKTKYILSQTGLDIQIIGVSVNPDDATGKILDLKPDLVISEMRMESMGAITLIKTLKEAGADCKFVILSYSWTVDDMRDFFEAGGTDYVLKSMDTVGISKMKTALARALGNDEE